jgi:hypothetical protein
VELFTGGYGVLEEEAVVFGGRGGGRKWVADLMLRKLHQLLVRRRASGVGLKEGSVEKKNKMGGSICRQL